MILLGWYLYKGPRYYEKKWIDIVRKFFNIFGVLYVLFYFLWGWQYFTPSLAERIHFVEGRIADRQLLLELEAQCIKLSGLRDSVRTHNKMNYEDFLNVENESRNRYVKLFHKMGTDIKSKVRVKPLKPKGILLKLSTAGVYIPYTFEGYVDDGLHTIQKPFTCAHEMAHGFGITDEGECNFLAYLVSSGSVNINFRYSGELAYYRYLRYVCNEINLQQAKDIVNNCLSSKVKDDLQSIMENNAKYPSIAEELRDKIYHYFLLSNGVEEGMNSYAQMVYWIVMWKQMNLHNEFLNS
jgi:hypothetical protein